MKNKNLINKIKEEYTVYIAGLKETVSQNTNNLKEEFDLDVESFNVLDTKNGGFLDLLNQLDGLAYGDKNLAMEKWVSLDCGMLPSTFIGLGKKADDLTDKIKNKFEISKDYNGLVPLTEYCAIPKSNKDNNKKFISHTLASIVNGEGLGLATKLIGLKALQADNIIGIAQYNNPSLKIHTKVNDLKLLTALTPAHSDPYDTFVYSCSVDQKKVTDLLLGYQLEESKAELPDNKSFFFFRF